MDRTKLRDIAVRFVAWYNQNTEDESVFASLVSKDLTVPIPYPQAEPTYAGLLQLCQQGHKSSLDFKVDLKNLAIDDSECKITMLLRFYGTHNGEAWIGIPASGKTFDVLGLILLKVDPASARIIEWSSITQDLVMLQQWGLIPETLT